MLKLDIKFGQIDLTQDKFILFFQRNLIMLSSNSKVELSIRKPKKFVQKRSISKNLVFFQFIYQLLNRKFLDCTIDERYSKKDTE